ncbi:cobalt-precorrin-7 (C(5))-methyltransferase [Enterococcus florum]|uniref:Cobalt-precorrin-7 (C(5))-methyltransferase n=1 Tax=Enterococcus florum TaxID=2480627 RepID=A0A4P5PFL4_9ENTE|nr:cobalt-precorrin-7 (C(5))-methyltransferase [Enterococcus florum]GCF95201.1 cobalt-precorrin-7 (C(5))-methyltransferase [Enterococcus florum]
MITVVGIGPGGTTDFLFGQALDSIEAASVIIGSERQLELVPEHKQMVCHRLPRKLTELEDYLYDHSTDMIVVLASGDPLTYGIGNWLMNRFSGDQLTILPGISSVHYFFNRLRIPMEDCYITSSHGRTPDYELLFQMSKVGMVTDQQIGPYQLAQEAIKRGMNTTFYIGEQLSYPDEQIRCFTSNEVPDEEYAMNVVVMINE